MNRSVRPFQAEVIAAKAVARFGPAKTKWPLLKHLVDTHSEEPVPQVERPLEDSRPVHNTIRRSKLPVEDVAVVVASAATKPWPSCAAVVAGAGSAANDELAQVDFDVAALVAFVEIDSE